MSVLRVLVVEDDFLIGMLLSETLVGMGHDVCAIEATEEDAVTAAIRLKPGLMIVDDRLGKGSGVSAVAAILRSDAIPHVFVSGDTVRIRALRPDSVVLQKPYKESDLARAIERALHPAVA